MSARCPAQRRRLLPAPELSQGDCGTKESRGLDVRPCNGDEGRWGVAETGASGPDRCERDDWHCAAVVVAFWTVILAIAIV